MSTTRISSKGQITLPASLLRERRLTPGTRLEVVATATAIVLLTIDEPLSASLAGRTGGIYGDAEMYVDEQRDTWNSHP